jgi:prefoldin subunit 5
MAKENKTSIDLVTVDLSKDKINELKEYNGKLQQVMTQIGQIHIRKNELHEQLSQIDDAVRKAEEDFKETNSIF